MGRMRWWWTENRWSQKITSRKCIARMVLKKCKKWTDEFCCGEVVQFGRGGDHFQVRKLSTWVRERTENPVGNHHLRPLRQSVGVANEKLGAKNTSQVWQFGCSVANLRMFSWVKVTKVKDNKLASALSTEGMRVQDKYYTYQNTHIQIYFPMIHGCTNLCTNPWDHTSPKQKKFRKLGFSKQLQNLLTMQPWTNERRSPGCWNECRLQSWKLKWKHLAEKNGQMMLYQYDHHGKVFELLFLKHKCFMETNLTCTSHKYVEGGYNKYN